MSRRTVEAEGSTLVVGWDRPLDTYFFQEWVDGEDDENPTRWEGFGENWGAVLGDRIGSVEALAERIGDNWVLDDEIREALRRDRVG